MGNGLQLSLSRYSDQFGLTVVPEKIIWFIAAIPISGYVQSNVSLVIGPNSPPWAKIFLPTTTATATATTTTTTTTSFPIYIFTHVGNFIENPAHLDIDHESLAIYCKLIYLCPLGHHVLLEITNIPVFNNLTGCTVFMFQNMHSGMALKVLDLTQDGSHGVLLQQFKPKKCKINYGWYLQWGKWIQVAPKLKDVEIKSDKALWPYYQLKVLYVSSYHSE